MQISVLQSDFLQAVLDQVNKRRTSIKSFGRLDVTCYRHAHHEELRIVVDRVGGPSLEARVWDDRLLEVLVSSTRKKLYGQKLYELQGRRLVGSPEEIVAAIRSTVGSMGHIEDSRSSEEFLAEIDACWRGVSVGLVD